MTTSPYDSDYPYAPQPIPAEAVTPARPRRQFPWKFIWRWTKRLALAAACAFAVAALLLALPLVRARRQAARIAELERIGCIVTYGPKIWGYDWGDSFPKSLRACFGDDFASEVGDVMLVREQDAISISPDDTRTICQICGQFPQLLCFTIHSDFFSYKEIGNWPHLRQLQMLSLHSPNLIDADVKEIAQLSQLRSLNIASPKLTSASLSELSNLQELRYLALEGVTEAPEARPNNASLPNLATLDIRNAPNFTDNAALSLPAMPELTTLHIDSSPIGDTGLAHFASGHKLEDVSLQGTQVTDAGLKSLASCVALRWLDLSGTKITDDGLAHLATCPVLWHLIASSTAVTGNGLASWPAQADSTGFRLTLDKSAADDASLATLLNIPHLSVLYLEDTKVTGTGTGAIARSEPFESLILNGASLTAEGFTTLATAKISDLSLTRTPLTDKQLLLFAANDDLTSLNVKETRLTAAGITTFYEARKLRLQAANKQETLILECDFPEAVQPFLLDSSMFEIPFIDASTLEIPFPCPPPVPRPPAPPSPAPPSPDPPQP
jgi:hypothetical protein